MCVSQGTSLQHSLWHLSVGGGQGHLEAILMLRGGGLPAFAKGKPFLMAQHLCEPPPQVLTIHTKDCDSEERMGRRNMVIPLL